jgi:hypothetical protein
MTLFHIRSSQQEALILTSLDRRPPAQDVGTKEHKGAEYDEAAHRSPAHADAEVSGVRGGAGRPPKPRHHSLSVPSVVWPESAPGAGVALTSRQHSQLEHTALSRDWLDMVNAFLEFRDKEKGSVRWVALHRRCCRSRFTYMRFGLLLLLHAQQQSSGRSQRELPCSCVPPGTAPSETFRLHAIRRTAASGAAGRALQRCGAVRDAAEGGHAR